VSLINKNNETMKQVTVIFALMLPFLIVCKSTNNKEILTSNGSNSIIVKDTQNKKMSVLNLSQAQLDKLGKESLINVSLLKVYRSNISFASDGELTDNLLGSNLSKEGLTKRFRLDFKEDTQYYELLGQKRMVYKYTYKSSFFKIYNYEEVGKNYLACGKIVDPEISVPYGIRIGMTKEDFFSKVFIYYNKFDFNGIDTVRNGDEEGGMRQYFIFGQNRLVEILIESDMTWISFYE
jgi:hypothetical protein